jgi:chromosomal replication initiator protein
MQTFARWIALPENRLARAATDRVVDAVCAGPANRQLNPLVLHGPPGTGKSHLAAALLAAVIAKAPDRTVVQRSASELLPPRGDEPDPGNAFADIREADLVVLDDLHRLPGRTVETLVQLLDRGLARGQQWAVTAVDGPAALTHLPSRLTSRLVSGLLVGLDPLSPDSRRVVLEAFTAWRGLAVPEDVRDWLADQCAGSFRELDGAAARLEGLAHLGGSGLTLAAVQEQFQAESAARQPTVERIVQRVGRHFRVDPDQLQGTSRTPGVLLPRQVGMYLTRRLTPLSLQQIGAYFGGRDHSTVLNACRKVEQALGRDALLAGAVRQLQADLA